MISNYVSDISHSHVNTSSIENDSDPGFVDALLGTYDNVPTLHATNEINFAQDAHPHYNNTHAHEKQRIVSIASEKDDSFSSRIPYYQFFTHPVSLTLFFNSWTFVSALFFSSFHFPIVMIMILFLGFHRIHLVV